MTVPLFGPLALIASAALAPAPEGTVVDTPPRDLVSVPYKDRIITSGKLQLLEPEEDEDPKDQVGLPRSSHADVILAHSQQGDGRFEEIGLAYGAFWETASIGSFSLDASAFHDKGSRRDTTGNAGIADPGSGGTATLWQRGLFLDGGWRVDNGFGVLATPSLPMQRSQYRFFLPSMPYAGASTEWRKDSFGLRLQAAAGRTGNFTGTHVAGFRLGDGNVASLGAQWRMGGHWNAMASFLGSEGILVPDPIGGSLLQAGTSRAVHLATGRESAHDSLQLNFLSSDGDPGSAVGAWIDGSFARGRIRHNYGTFHFGRDLVWGALPINNNVEGAYYRIAYQYGRWLWNGGVDTARPVSGVGSDALYGTAYARYRYSSTLAYGGNLSVRSSAGTMHSLQLFADKRTRWGQTRLQMDQAGGGGDSWQLSVDHAFELRGGGRLSTSLGFGEISREGIPENTTSFAVYGERDLGDRFTLDGSARWTHGDGPTALRGVNLNLGLNWRIAPRWQLSTTIYQSQGSQRSPFDLDPLDGQNQFLALPRDRSVFLTLRHDQHAGRSQAVLGGAPGAAAGAISGSLFLDENRDDVRSATEQAAANVTVLLDGRYSVRSDDLGRFEFPRVSAGAHSITVDPDNLPLPWSFANGAETRQVQVSVRGQVKVDIGAQRPQ